MVLDDDKLSDESTIHSDDDLEVTGLRNKRLMAMIVCLGILFVLTIVLLILNILIITTLRMNPSGIKFLHFHHNVNRKTGEMEKTVEMTGDRIEFENIVSDRIVGFPNKDISLNAARILATSKDNKTLFELNNNECKLLNMNNFQVLNKKGRTLFSAKHPTVKIDHRIKKISAEKIITNKIRSAVDESLKISGENVLLRGNEYVKIDGRLVGLESATRIVFNSSNDGSITLKGKVRLGDGSTTIPISTSPSLSASLDGLRLCACAQFNHKLFLVSANKPCNAHHSFCS